MAIPDRFQRFQRRLFVRADRRHQTVHNNIRLFHAQFQRARHNFFDDGNLLIQIFGQSLVRQRQKDKHRAVFFCQRQQLFELFGFQRNRIDQCASRITPKRFLLHVHMAGIDGQRQLRHTRYLFQRLQHHRLFVDSAHAHVDIQNRRTAFFLLLCKLRYKFKAALAQLLLQLLFTGRIDSFANDQKRSVQIKGQGRAFRSQCSLRRVSMHRNRSSCQPVGHFADMLRRRAAAAAQNLRPCVQQKLHICAEFLRSHIVNGLPFFIQRRKSCVWLCDDGNIRHLRHPADDLCHLIRSG